MTRDLRLLALAVGLSAAGDMVALITLSLRVHDQTGSAFAVSALRAAGLDAENYEGSWHEWARRQS